MNYAKASSSLLAVLAIALAPAAARAADPAPAAPAAKTPQELKALVQQNNGRVGQLVRELEGTFGANKGKDYAKVDAAVKELRDLMALKEGAPDAIDEARLQYLLAKVYSRPLDLRRAPLAEKAFQAALAAEKDPVRKAWISYDYAKFRRAAALDDEPEKWEKAMADAFNTPGLPALARLDLLEAGIPGLDYEKDGLKAVANDPAALEKYYRRLTEPSRYRDVETSIGKALNPEFSREHWLELCDKAIAACPGRADDYRMRKADALVALGRAAEAEQLLFDGAATTNVAVRRSYLGKLGEFYSGRATRYYLDPAASPLRKALNAYESRLELDPRNGGYARSVVETAMRLADWPLAKTILDKYVADFCGGKPDAYIARHYGDLCYHTGDYAKACEYYGMHALPVARSLPNSVQYYAESLYACGRYAEALVQLDKFPNNGAYRDYVADLRRRLKAKIGAGAK